MARPGIADRLSIFLGEKLSYLFLISVVLTAYEVVMRYVFNAPTIWVHDSTVALSAVAFIFGGAYALQRGEHIRISTVYDLAPPRLRWIFDLVCAVVAVVYLGLLTYAATRTAIPSLRVMETSAHAWDVPIPAFLKAMLVLGAFLALVQALALLWRRIVQRG